MTTRSLVVILGDQLDDQSSAFDDFDPTRDRVWMAEVSGESTHVWSSKVRTAFFLSAMRHFAEALRGRGWKVLYSELDDSAESLAEALERTLARDCPSRVVMTAPGDHRVLRALEASCRERSVPLEIRPDRHFFSTPREFAEHARGRKSLRMEYFYREMRRRFDVLMDEGEPLGGAFNFDEENRKTFPKSGPPPHKAPPRFPPDEITREVIALVERRFPDHPGRLDAFGWPVTRQDALLLLEDFLEHRLPDFGPFQDALWPGEPWLWHSLLSASLNVKLLGAREVVAAAERAHREGRVSLASAEGFIRQILGWREYVRGIYWTQMPDYAERNALDARESLPEFFWTGRTTMRCVSDAVGQTLAFGYAHHIQRLMVTGLFALLYGVEPRLVHEWYLAVYVDAVEWVELPNTLGMSQFADGGLLGSKPYVASGKYIERMSSGSLCGKCRFRPEERVGERACPFTTLYWDFLDRHEGLLRKNPRMGMQLKNLARLPDDERRRVRERAAWIREPKSLALDGSDDGR